LHEANCYLDVGASGCGLSIRYEDGEVMVVLESVDNLTAARRRQPGRAGRDLTHLQRILHAAGCGRTDLCRFRVGYRQAQSVHSIESETKTTRRSRDAGRGDEVMRGDDSLSVWMSGRDSLWQRLIHGVRRLCQRPDWVSFVGPDWADRIMDVAVTDRFHAKQGRSTGRWVLHMPAMRRLSVYLKRHYELPWWRGLMALLWPGRPWSPALQEWRNLEWARRQGVPVPEVVAAAEYVGPWCSLRSFLAVEELAGMLPLHEAIPLAAVRQDAAAFRRWKRSLVAEMARLTRMLHDRRCFHKDLYLCHFYVDRDETLAVPPEGWHGRVYLIDLHRLSHNPLTWRVWQIKDLAQLLYSSEIVGVDARDRLGFWREYSGIWPSRRDGGWLRRFVLLKWRRYRRHNARAKLYRRDVQGTL
jgi:heptose I phosphotransferase